MVIRAIDGLINLINKPSNKTRGAPSLWLSNYCWKALSENILNIYIYILDLMIALIGYIEYIEYIQPLLTTINHY